MPKPPELMKPRSGAWRLAGLGLVFVWFFLGGIGHFVFTGVFTAVTPGWVPFPREVVLATGACEIAGALALFRPELRRPAGLALILLAICVTPVHVEMLQHADRYKSLGLPALWIRLAMQPILIWIIWTVTKPRAAVAAS